MMIAVDESGRQVTASEATRSENYFCPVCTSKLTYKSGNVKVPHFSHYHMRDCIRYFYKKESSEHLKIKHDIYLMLSPQLHVAMEYYIPEIEQIPDLLVGGRIALEIQLSRISPTLIVDRTRGYHSVGKDVIWILNDEDIRMNGMYCIPTHFHLSTMDRGMLTTYNASTETFYQYHLHHNIGSGKWTFDKEEVTVMECLQLNISEEIGCHVLSLPEIENIIKNERQKRSVLNPTMSLMYQLKLNAKTIPSYIAIVTPIERLILNNPLEWKLYLMYHLSQESFNINHFMSTIEIRTMINLPSKQKIVRTMLNDYIFLYRSQ